LTIQYLITLKTQERLSEFNINFFIENEMKARALNSAGCSG